MQAGSPDYGVHFTLEGAPSKLRLGGDFLGGVCTRVGGKAVNFPTLTSKRTTLGWGTPHDFCQT